MTWVRKAYEVVAVLHPMEPGSTAGDLIGCGISAHKASSGRESAHCNEPKLAVVGRRFTMGLKEERQ